MGNYIVTCGPNAALVVSGGRESSIRIGGRAVVIPCLQRVDQLSLELRTLSVKSVNATTLQGVQISVEGIAQVKVSGFHENDNKVLSTDMNAIRLAAQHFLGSTDEYVYDESLLCILSVDGGMLRCLLDCFFGEGVGEGYCVTIMSSPVMHLLFSLDVC